MYVFQQLSQTKRPLYMTDYAAARYATSLKVSVENVQQHFPAAFDLMWLVSKSLLRLMKRFSGDLLNRLIC